MTPKDRVMLRFGPYRTPSFKYGDVVFCERFGEVTLCGLSSGRISWPLCQRGTGKAIALVGSLVDAIRRESVLAIRHWWGVGSDTVWKWRRVLSVKATEGTSLLKSDYAYETMDTRLPKALAKARDPERCAKIAAAKRGRPCPPHVIRVVITAHLGTTHSEASRRKMSETHRRLGTRPPAAGRPWTPNETHLLRVLPPKEVAERTGRTLKAVYFRRSELGLPDRRWRNGKKPRKPWTPEEDALLFEHPASEVAKRSGRKLHAVYKRRDQLRAELHGCKGLTFPDARAKNGRKARVRKNDGTADG